MILSDIHKAFDNVDYSTLSLKLEAAGLGQDMFRWFRS